MISRWHRRRSKLETEPKVRWERTPMMHRRQLSPFRSWMRVPRCRSLRRRDSSRWSLRVASHCTRSLISSRVPRMLLSSPIQARQARPTRSSRRGSRTPVSPRKTMCCSTWKQTCSRPCRSVVVQLGTRAARALARGRSSHTPGRKFPTARNLLRAQQGVLPLRWRHRSEPLLPPISPSYRTTPVLARWKMHAKRLANRSNQWLRSSNRRAMALLRATIRANRNSLPASVSKLSAIFVLQF